MMRFRAARAPDRRDDLLREARDPHAQRVPRDGHHHVEDVEEREEAAEE